MAPQAPLASGLQKKTAKSYRDAVSPQPASINGQSVSVKKSILKSPQQSITLKQNPNDNERYKGSPQKKDALTTAAANSKDGTATKRPQQIILESDNGSCRSLLVSTDSGLPQKGNAHADPNSKIPVKTNQAAPSSNIQGTKHGYSVKNTGGIPKASRVAPVPMAQMPAPSYSPRNRLDMSKNSNASSLPDEITAKLHAANMSYANNQKQDQQPTYWKDRFDKEILCDLEKYFTFEEVADMQIKELVRWKENDLKGKSRTLYIKEISITNDLIMNVTDKTRLERLQNYEDRLPCLNLRKFFKKIRIYINLTAYNIIKHRVFEALSIMIIVANSITLGAEDPTQEEQTPFFLHIDNVFLALYTTEMVLKILGLGFIFNEGAYLRDSWNILDFIIVASAYVTLAQSMFVSEDAGTKGDDEGFSLNSLRAFRVLRPLKTITSIKGLKILVQSLIAAFPLLTDTVIVLLFFFLIEAIAGTQLLNGQLMQTCVNIETGKRHEDDILCGGMQECPSEYFCGRQNENPNYGVTNFDIIFYSVLTVFQCVTLEGWSEIQVMYQQTYTYYIFFFFLPLVFLGAFFLLNLTLAVINTQFSRTHNAAKEAEAKAKALAKKRRSKNQDEIELMLEDNAQKPDEIGISEFIIAKRAAKKMIKFYRQRQEAKQKQQEEEEQQQPQSPKKGLKKLTSFKRKQSNASQSPSRSRTGTVSPTKGPTVQPVDQKGSLKEQLESNVNQIAAQQSSLTGTPIDDRKIGQVSKFYSQQHKQTPDADDDQNQEYNKPITEDSFEDLSDESHTASNHHMQVVEFLRNLGSPANSQTQKPEAIKKEESENRIKKLMNAKQPKLADNVKRKEIASTEIEGIKIKTKVSANKTEKENKVAQYERAKAIQEHNKFAFDKRIKEEFEIDKVIAVDHLQPQNRKNIMPHDFDKVKKGENFVEEEPEFDLSYFRAITPEYYPNYASDDDGRNKSPNSKYDLEEDLQSSVISSDSSLNSKLEPKQRFDKMTAQEKARYDKDQFLKSKARLKRNITKEFRRTNTYNSKKENQQQKNIFDDTVNSTQYKDGGLDARSNNTIMGTSSGFKRNKARPGSSALSKAQSFVTTKQARDFIRQKAVLEYRKIQDDFDARRVIKDPYENINKKTHKIQINPGIKYKSTSQNEVFETRLNIIDAKQLNDLNKFIKLPDSLLGNIDGDYADKDFIKPKFAPYQLKQRYQVKQEEEFEFSDDDEDALMLAQQPYDTVTQIGYKMLLRKMPTRFVTRRSDIVVSSTLSITLTPQDSAFEPVDIRRLTDEELTEWIDKRNEFRAMNVGTAHMALSDHEMSDYLMSVDDGVNSPANCLNTPPSQAVQSPVSGAQAEKFGVLSNSSANKKRFIPPSLLSAVIPPDQLFRLSDEERRLYQTQKAKWDATNKIISKRDVNPVDTVFTLEKAKLLVEGKYHDEDEDDDGFYFDDGGGTGKPNQTFYRLRNEDFNAKSRLEAFERTNNRYAMGGKTEEKAAKEDNIPKEIREEFDIPEDLGDAELDYQQIREHDSNRKCKRPLWSGQDILETNLNQEQSEWVTGFFNRLRVWPKGNHGVVKKARFTLRMFVKSSFFENFMTFAVLLNTVALAMDRYGMPEDEKAFLETTNEIFTWIFIVEMSMKLLAIGASKYCQERMNLIDGVVVLLSIVEMSLSTGGTSLSAFRTIRIFRTFRVLRVARLLRALHSMQVIIGVITRSFDSFIYIAILLFVFIFIYALLGMQIFGNNFNFPEGKPRGNYDTFDIAFVTVFQVLTMENWQLVLFDSMRSELGKFIPAIFYISWIFLGNFILLNLFLAILLDSFLTEDEEQDMSEEALLLEQKKKAEQKKRRDKEKERRLKRLGTSVLKSGNFGSIQRAASPQKKLFQLRPEVIVEDIEDLDMNQVLDIFREQGVLKKDKDKAKQKPLFVGVEATESLYLFKKTNCIRILCYKTYKHKRFENIIQALILLSSGKLAFDTFFFYEDPDSQLIKTSEALDIFFNVAFCLEMVIKVTAMGLIMDEGSYLRESWNQLDCFIVVSSMIDMLSAGAVDLPVIKVLRLLRTLRPLRFISHNVALKMIVAALMESVSSIFNVMIVVMVVWLMFAIFGINLFSGKFFYCSVNKYKHHTEPACLEAGGEWKRYDSNFDNAGQAMLTLFIVSSLEGWPDIMLQSVDATEVDEGPLLEASPANAYFFVIFILIGSFFFLNFFIGVLFLKYTQAQKEEKKGFTNDNLNWIDIQRMIVGAQPVFEIANKPPESQPWRLKVWRLVNNQIFEYTILACIMLNMVQMSLLYTGASLGHLLMLKITNYIFSTVFLVECVLKLFAYRSAYFQTAWNQFDFFVVCASIIDLGLELIGTGGGMLSVAPQLARVLRVLRVSRVLRVAKSFKGLTALIQTITLSIPSLANVFGLLLLILFMFSILGVFFFRGIAGGLVINEYKNFWTFSDGFLLLFAISTGEDWNRLMYDCVNSQDCFEGQAPCSTEYAPAFYITFIMIVSHVMLNLFILVIIQQFDTYYVSDDNPLQKFKNNLDTFQETWSQLTQKQKCRRIRERDLYRFFKELPSPLGMSDISTEDEIKKRMLKMGIRCDDGYIYFNELLYRCMRAKYCNFKLNRKMQIIELNTQFKIYKITVKQQNKKNALKNQKIFFENMLGKSKSVNPFLTTMYFNISFKKWLNETRKRISGLEWKEAQERCRAKAEAEGVPFVMQEQHQEPTKYQTVSIQIEHTSFYTSEEEDQPPTVQKSSINRDGDRNSPAMMRNSSSRGSFRDLNATLAMKSDQKDTSFTKKKSMRKIKQHQIRKQKTMMTTSKLPSRQSRLVGLGSDAASGSKGNGSNMKGSSGMKLLDTNHELIPRQVVLSGTNQRRKSVFPTVSAGGESLY